MRFGEKTADNLNTDYWFLRDNGVSGVTAMYMVGIVYKRGKKEE